jgi:3-hydroxyisobutyrate dehydrogenase
MVQNKPDSAKQTRFRSKEQTMNSPTIAFLGFGAMASRLVQSLINAQYSVTVYNRTADKLKPFLEQGVTYAATPRAAAEQADIVISMVTDDQASRSVWLHPETGALLGLKKDAVAIESSTLTVDWVKELSGAVAQQGAAFLDAPVVGSRPQAEAGKLIYLVGGNLEPLAQVQPVLLSAGAAMVQHVGTVGQGMAMKLAVNTLFGVQVAALAEAIALLKQQGIPADQAMACLGELPVTSLAAKVAGSLMVANQHEPLFPIALVEKDFRYTLQASVAMPTAKAVQAVYQAAIEKDLGDRNITAIVHLFE